MFIDGILVQDLCWVYRIPHNFVVENLSKVEPVTLIWFTSMLV